MYLYPVVTCEAEIEHAHLAAQVAQQVERGGADASPRRTCRSTIALVRYAGVCTYGAICI